MMKKFIFVCYNGWCNDDAPWSHVFTSLATAFCVFFVLTFILSRWMMIIY